MSGELWVSRLTGYRRKGTRFSSLKKLFVDNVTAKSIFEPLSCCPASSRAEDAKDALRVREFDVAGVKETVSGEVIGYLITAELHSGEIRKHVKVIGPDLLISDSTPIADIFTALTSTDFTFVLYGKHIVGIITKADINKPPVRIYLFGMTSLFEMHLNAWINHFFPNSSWETEVPNSRMKTARDMYEARREEKQDLSLLECLQLCDKRDLLKKSDSFIKEFGTSKKEFETFVKQVEGIRNDLAHSQNSIISNGKWTIFVETLSCLESFLMRSDSKVEDMASKGEAFKDLLI